MPNAIFAVVYTSDAGNRYKVGMDSEVFGQNSSLAAPKVGGELWNGSEILDGFPANMKPRRVRLVNPAGNQRYVTILSDDATLWTGAGVAADRQLTIEDSDGAGTVYTWEQNFAQSQRRRKRRA